MSPKRPATLADRDEFVRKTPPEGVAKQLAVPEDFISEPLTGRVDLNDDELLEARRERAAADPAGRIALLETEQKTMGTDIAAIKVSMATMQGDQKAQTVALQGIEKAFDRMSKREAVEFESETKVNAAQQIDAIEAKKAKRDFWFKMGGSSVVGAIVLKLLQHYGVL